MRQIVAYYRVSTSKQGHSGLGLDSQRRAIAEHCRATGDVLLAEYTEIESGRKSVRPELQRALRFAKAVKATLTVAKLDRLSRNVAFLSAMMESKVEFLACDMPDANKLVLHMVAVVAEYEVDLIRARTKAALQAAKARGKLLGSHRPGHWDGHEEQRRAGAKKGGRVTAQLRYRECREGHADYLPLIRVRFEAGDSYRVIAKMLNDQKHTTHQGKPWTPMAVLRTLRREGISKHENDGKPLMPTPLTR